MKVKSLFLTVLAVVGIASQASAQTLTHLTARMGDVADPNVVRAFINFQALASSSSTWDFTLNGSTQSVNLSPFAPAIPTWYDMSANTKYTLTIVRGGTTYTDYAWGPVLTRPNYGITCTKTGISINVGEAFAGDSANKTIALRVMSTQTLVSSQNVSKVGGVWIASWSSLTPGEDYEIVLTESGGTTVYPCCALLNP